MYAEHGVSSTTCGRSPRARSVPVPKCTLGAGDYSQLEPALTTQQVLGGQTTAAGTPPTGGVHAVVLDPAGVELLGGRFGVVALSPLNRQGGGLVDNVGF